MAGVARGAPAVVARRQAGEGTELAGEMGLVRIAFCGGQFGPGDFRFAGKAVEGASEAAQSAPRLRREADSGPEELCEVAVADVEITGDDGNRCP